MTTVNGVTTATTTVSSAAASNGLSGDLDTFLKMLTTQLKYQDPLNPEESTDFAVQLATFSGVEQQVKTNDLLEQLGGSTGLSGLGGVAGWVGMEARVAAPVGFTGSPVSLSLSPDTRADSATLVTYDSRNREVKREAVPATPGDFTWVGSDGKGGVLPAGTYSFRLESQQGGTLLTTTAVETYARVTEVRSGSDGPVLVLGNASTVKAADVTALR